MATAEMMHRLQGNQEIANHIIPKWSVGCKRPSPGPGFLEALIKDNVTVVKDEIVRIDETGLITADGTHHEVDAIVCATGFDVSFRPRYDLVGKNGLNLTEAWKTDSRGYLSYAVGGMPNLFCE